MTGPKDLYRYRARLLPWGHGEPLPWHDGDTFMADVDLGVRAHWHGRVRPAGFDTPEINRAATRAAGLAAKAFLATLLPEGSIVYLNSIDFVATDEADSFGRMLAYVTLSDGRELADIVIGAGHAVVA